MISASSIDAQMPSRRFPDDLGAGRRRGDVTGGRPCGSPGRGRVGTGPMADREPHRPGSPAADSSDLPASPLPVLARSVAELASISSDCGDRVSAHAVLLQPGGGREDWGQSEIAADLADLPRLRIWPDRGGDEIRRFGVTTSGHVLLYDPGGRLIFSGGITPARGHQGANGGREGVLAGVLRTGGGGPKYPVFGCPLATPRRTSSQGPS